METNTKVRCIYFEGWREGGLNISSLPAGSVLIYKLFTGQTFHITANKYNSLKINA